MRQPDPTAPPRLELAHPSPLLAATAGAPPRGDKVVVAAPSIEPHDQDGAPESPWRRFSLRFADDALEDAFEAFHRSSTHGQAVAVVVLAIAIWISFGAVDWTYGGDHFGLLAIMRYVVVLPGMFVVLALLLRGAGPATTQLTMGAQQILLVTASYVMPLWVGLEQAPVLLDGVLVLLMAGYAVLPLRFAVACVAGKVSLLGFAVNVIALADDPLDAWVLIAFVAAADVTGMVAAHVLEVQRRSLFLRLHHAKASTAALTSRNEELDELASQDPVTGLYNRRRFDLDLAAMLEGRGETAAVAGALLIDLDRFKAVNDTHGHLAGDDLLYRVSQHLRRHIRAADHAYRVGGDEFAVLLPGANDDVVERMGRRVLAGIEAYAQGHPGLVKLQFGCTIGATTLRVTDGSARDVVARLDSALYAGKRRGGGAVVLA